MLRDATATFSLAQWQFYPQSSRLAALRPGLRSRITRQRGAPPDISHGDRGLRHPSEGTMKQIMLGGVVAVAVLAAGCGGQDAASEPTTTPSTETTTGTATTTPDVTTTVAG